jgi:outer membrane protein TolC
MRSRSCAVALLAGLVAGFHVPTASAQTIAPPPGAQAGKTGPVRQITIVDAVQLALEQNLNVQVERINPAIQDETVGLARAAFAPALTGDLSYNSTDTPPDSTLSGASTTLKSDFFQTSAGVQQFLPWGGTSYNVGWDGSRSTSNNSFLSFNPRLRSNVQLQVTQPLLRNFAVDSARTQLVVSRRNRDISDVDLRTTVVQTVRTVKNAYWDLKYALANLDVQRQSLDLARQTLKDNRTRVEVGTMAPIDIVEAEAEVARNEEAVIIAEASIKQAEDRLRAVIFDPSTPDFWSMTLEPVDAPQMDAVPVDLDAAVRNALDKRTDLRRAKLGLENVAESLRYYRNQRLPQVNAQLVYAATGLGGTELEREEGFPVPGPVIREVTRGFGSVLNNVFAADYPAWTFGVTFAYPIGRSNADANYARTRLEQSQAQLQIKTLELQVGTQVRDVARQVNTNIKRIDATRASRVLSERRLEAEQKKFGVGMSTSFLVFQAQRDLATARANELRAILDYNKSLADFEAVEEAPLAGTGVTISSGGGVLATSAGSATAAGLTQSSNQRQ